MIDKLPTLLHYFNLSLKGYANRYPTFSSNNNVIRFNHSSDVFSTKVCLTQIEWCFENLIVRIPKTNIISITSKYELAGLYNRKQRIRA
jgi:hypothetical protein